jgi:glycosyltransferase involved in cell wall biosynthesis
LILYLTHNDAPGGVYRSQVADVVAHLNALGPEPVRLVALVSLRGYWGQRRAIRRMCPGAWVLPMVPGVRRWRANARLLGLLCRILRPQGIVARGPFAAWMALRQRDRGLVRRVCFDARGAYAAEWEEYRIVDDERLIAQAKEAERRALAECDLRLAVSHALVAWWQERYGSVVGPHVVVPCTLSREALAQPLEREDARTQWGYGPADVVLVYAGSVAGWQSLAALDVSLAPLLEQQPAVKLLFLSRPDPVIDALATRLPGRVQRLWTGPEEVPTLLAACDHGLLLREASVTNRVASPVKFAEYLHAGLPVLISPQIGDCSAWVQREQAGSVWGPGMAPPRLHPTDPATRRRMRELAVARFSKSAYAAEYRRLIEMLTAP